MANFRFGREFKFTLRVTDGGVFHPLPAYISGQLYPGEKRGKAQGYGTHEGKRVGGHRLRRNWVQGGAAVAPGP